MSSRINFRAIVVALFPFGAVFGSFMGAPLADRYGRRLTLFINCVPAALAGVFFLLAYFCKKWYLFYPGRLLIGINSGTSSSYFHIFSYFFLSFTNAFLEKTELAS